MELETRIGNAIVSALNAASGVLDEVVGGSEGDRNIEYSTAGNITTDDRRVPGHVHVAPLPAVPLPEDGEYHDSTRTRFQYRVRFQMADDLERAQPEKRVYHALRRALRRREFFSVHLLDPEENLLLRDGEIDVEPEIIEGEGGKHKLYDAVVGVSVRHKVWMAEPPAED